MTNMEEINTVPRHVLRVLRLTLIACLTFAIAQSQQGQTPIPARKDVCTTATSDVIKLTCNLTNQANKKWIPDKEACEELKTLKREAHDGTAGSSLKDYCKAIDTHADNRTKEVLKKCGILPCP